MKINKAKNHKKENKEKNPKTANPITMDTDPNMKKPVRGLDNV